MKNRVFLIALLFLASGFSSLFGANSGMLTVSAQQFTYDPNDCASVGNNCFTNSFKMEDPNDPNLFGFFYGPNYPINDQTHGYSNTGGFTFVKVYVRGTDNPGLTETGIAIVEGFSITASVSSDGDGNCTVTVPLGSGTDVRCRPIIYYNGTPSGTNIVFRWEYLIQDEPLRFTSGSVSGTTATLNLAGNSNLVCAIERLDFPSGSWVSQGNLTLNGSGTGSTTASLTNGLGYFRAQSTNGAFLSTNAFGSIVGSVPPGNWMVGNPFPPINTSVMFPTPIDGMTVHYSTNNGFASSGYDIFGGWSDDRGIATGEGVLVFVPNGPSAAFQTYGLFYTNYFSRTLSTNFSMIASPLYHKLSGGSATQIDEFNSTRLGGYSLVPVNSSSNPKATASRNKSGVANQYIDYTLTTGSQWQTNSVNTTVPILIGEGFWIENRFGSAQTWTVPVFIW